MNVAAIKDISVYGIKLWLLEDLLRLCHVCGTGCHNREAGSLWDEAGKLLNVPVAGKTLEQLLKNLKTEYQKVKRQLCVFLVLGQMIIQNSTGLHWSLTSMKSSTVCTTLTVAVLDLQWCIQAFV